jgi:serine/threonine protein kinase
MEENSISGTASTNNRFIVTSSPILRASAKDSYSGLVIGTPPGNSENNSIDGSRHGDRSVHRSSPGFPRGSLAGVPPSPLLVSSGLGGSLKSRLDMAVDDLDLLQKQVLWEIDRSEVDLSNKVPLGVGSYGEVLKGKWRGMTVAVKTVMVTESKSNSELDKAALLSEQRHEIAVMSHMHHPRVVQFLGACTRSQPWLLLSEYMKGGSVAALLAERKGRTIPMEFAIRWALDTAQALRYLHEHKPRAVIHRDIKPQNLLIDGSWHVKVSDFGLSQMYSQARSLTDTAVSASVATSGSRRYMAPEVFKRALFNEKVDIYSFGFLCYDICHGEPLTREDLDPSQTSRQAIEGVRPEMNPNLGIPPEFESLIKRCWAVNPDERPSAKECCTILSKLDTKQETANLLWLNSSEKSGGPRPGECCSLS